MDAIIIADSGSASISATNQLKLTLGGGRVATIQAVKNLLENDGRVLDPVAGDGVASWSSSLKLNGVFLSSFLSGQGFSVALIDSYHGERERFRELLERRPRAVVISTTFIMSKKTLHALVSDIRAAAPGIPVIAGGQYVYLSFRLRERLRAGAPLLDIYRGDYLFLDERDEPPVDLYVVSACGEQTLAQALGRLRDGRDLAGLPNTATYASNRYRFSERVDDVERTGGSAVDWKRLPQAFFASGVVPMQASYGCPYRCAFCNFMKDRRLMGVKPLDALVGELKAVQERGARYVWFVDDNFRLGSNDLAAVCRRFIDEKLALKWKSFIRASALKRVDMGLLKSAGCIEIQLGLESADPGILAGMRKAARPELYAEVIERALRAGINCSCYFLFGFPGETAETVQRTRDFIASIEHPELDGYLTCTMFPFVIAPLSPISEAELARRHGLKGTMFDWEHATMNSRQAVAHATEAFLALEASDIIYHADNLDLLLGLDPRRRKQFIATRHRIAAQALRGAVSDEEVRKAFAAILS